MIYILRNPIDRIIFHYLHNLSAGRERRSFQDAVLGNAPHYLNVSRYYLQLTRYLEYFPPERILLLIFVEFVRNKLATLRHIFEFLEINTDFVPPNLDEMKNVTADKMISHPALGVIRSIPLYRHLPWLLRSSIFRILQRPLPIRSEFCTPTLWNRTLDLLHQDIIKIQDYMRSEITAWDLPKLSHGVGRGARIKTDFR